MERTIKKISVFDFDGTLVNTELPDTGKPKWLAAKGEKWPHKGWWGRAESLDTEVFESPIIEHVVEDYRKEKNGPENLVVMLTGRMVPLAKHVDKILEKHGLEFDRKYCHDSKCVPATGASFNVQDTITWKKYKIEELLREFPDVEVVELWEDRAPHVELFKEWGETITPKVIVNFVEPVVQRF